MDMEWRTLQALELREKNKMLTNIETFQPNDLVYLLTPYSSSLQSKAEKFRQDYIGPLAIDTKLDDTHYLLKDVTGRTLPGDYHINRIKRAKEVTLIRKLIRMNNCAIKLAYQTTHASKE